MTDRAPVAQSLKAFSEAHGISRSTIYREIKAGRLKAHKSGFRTLIKAEDAKDWLDSLPELSPKAA